MGSFGHGISGPGADAPGTVALFPKRRFYDPATRHFIKAKVPTRASLAPGEAVKGPVVTIAVPAETASGQ